MQRAYWIVSSAVEAVAAAHQLGGKVVMKVQSPQALHKSDLGGVQTGIEPKDAGEAFDRLRAILASDPAYRGVLVQRQMDADVELIVAVTRPAYGYPLVLTVGFGGVATELYADVASTLLPTTDDEVLRLIGDLRAAPLLFGHRGRGSVNVTATVAAIRAIADLAGAMARRLIELEINPLLVSDAGAYVADFLLRLSPAEEVINVGDTSPR